MTDVLKYHLDGMAEAGHAPPNLQAFNSDGSIQSILINIQIDGGGDSLKALARIIVGATKLSDDFTSRRPLLLLLLQQQSYHDITTCRATVLQCSQP